MEGLSGQEIRGRERAVARPHLMCALLSLASIISLGQASSCFARPVIHKSGGLLEILNLPNPNLLGMSTGPKIYIFGKLPK